MNTATIERNSGDFLSENIFNTKTPTKNAETKNKTELKI